MSTCFTRIITIFAHEKFPLSDLDKLKDMSHDVSNFHCKNYYNLNAL